jgi:glycine hydroxymethyltransferase
MNSYLEALAAFNPDIHGAILGEQRRQAAGIEMIPSENYTRAAERYVRPPDVPCR